MPGLVVFDSLTQALQAGFQVYDRTTDGYLVRQRAAGGDWAFALVRCSQTEPKEWR